MIRRGPWKLIYYSEFDSYQLFNLASDPGETTDLAAMDEHRPLAADLLARIHGRWSAQDMMRHAARQRQSWRLIHACGHDFLPHAVEHPRPRPEDNRFDFRQLPASQR
jgi:hypothetical protein